MHDGARWLSAARPIRSVEGVTGDHGLLRGALGVGTTACGQQSLLDERRQRMLAVVGGALGG